MKIYLDTCCLGRFFDDQTKQRIAEEAAALARVFGLIAARSVDLVSSELLEQEISLITDIERRTDGELRLAAASDRVTMNTRVVARGRSLESLGFSALDARHLAAAEDGSAEFFLTTDDRLVRRAARLHRRLSVSVINPVPFLLELNNAKD